MGAYVRIEIDQSTADSLMARAEERGVTVRELLAELVAADGETRTADRSEIAELDRRAAATEGGHVPQAQVVEWLHTWGTTSFRPWRAR
jgi:hypothetical protein